MERDKFRCVACDTDSNTLLNVHHGYYVTGAKPWEYPDDSLWTLCEDCHKAERYRRQRIAEAIGKIQPRKCGSMLLIIRNMIEGLAKFNDPHGFCPYDSEDYQDV